MGEYKKISKGIVILITGIIIITSISFIMLFTNRKGETKDNGKQLAGTVNYLEEANSIEEASSTSDKTINEVKENKVVLNTEELVNNKQEEKVKKDNTEEKIEKKEVKKENKKKEIKFEKPVEGKILKEFAKENLVFSNTLNEWTTHSGIDISADKTTIVKSAYEGTVEAIKNDPRYGLTVIIAHQDGYKTIYSNLLTAEFVAEGEKISTGQTIGTVGNTATFEIADESHLHFEILKDNNQVDPTIYIKY